jgi:hypothetical protein
MRGFPEEIGGHDAASCPPISSEVLSILHQHVAQKRTTAPFRLVADDVFFTEVFSFDDDVGRPIMGNYGELWGHLI